MRPTQVHRRHGQAGTGAARLSPHTAEQGCNHAGFTRVHVPIFGQRGRLLAAPGQHTTDEVLVASTAPLKLGAWERPSHRDLEQARVLLVDDLLGRFRFVSPPDRAHALGALLAPFLRRLMRTAAPVFLIEAANGAEADLAELIAEIVAGRQEALAPRQRGEALAAIDAQIEAGAPVVVLDASWPDVLDDRAVVGRLTSPWIVTSDGRALERVLQNWPIWLLTGSSATASAAPKAVVRIQLEGHAGGWSEPGSAVAWVRANRGELVTAVLTLCQAWISTGAAWAPQDANAVLGGVLANGGVHGWIGHRKAKAPRRAAASNLVQGPWRTAQ